MLVVVQATGTSPQRARVPYVRVRRRLRGVGCRSGLPPLFTPEAGSVSWLSFLLRPIVAWNQARRPPIVFDQDLLSDD